MSARRTESPIHAAEQAPRPLMCLRCPEPGAVEADVMQQAFREHNDLAQVAARVLTSIEQVLSS